MKISPMGRPDPIASFLARRELMILDGGLATALEARGYPLDSQLWSASLLWEAPEAIRRLHLDYFLAGADVAISASYQLSRSGLERAGWPLQRFELLLRRSVALALQARHAFLEAHPEHAPPLVAASVGPYGAALADGSEYRGRYGKSVQALFDWHRPRLEVLADAGADLLAMETIPCLREAEALLRALDLLPEAWAWMSFTCRDNSRLRSGEPLADAIALAAAHPRIAALGVNCTEPRFVADLLAVARHNGLGRPLLAYPNSGETWDAAHRRWQAGSAAGSLADYGPAWRSAGARLIGGCCRTSPEDIRNLSARLRG